MIRRLLGFALGLLSAFTVSPLPGFGGTTASCPLPTEITIPDLPAVKTALADFRELNTANGVAVRPARTGETPWLKLRLTDEDTPPHPQGYRMTVGDGGVILAARTPEGLSNAIRSLALMILQQPDGPLPAGSRLATPAIPERAVAFSVRKLQARHLPSLKRFIRMLGMLKYNRAFIEFGDNFPLDPDLYPRNREPLAAEQIGDITRFAAERFIRITPILRVWSDCPMLENRSDREVMFEVPKPRLGLMPYCPLHPKVRELIRRTVAGHCRALHPKEYFFRIDRKELRHHFRQCRRCQNVPPERLFAEHLAFLAKCATDADARPGFLLLNFRCHNAGQLAAAIPAGAAVFGPALPPENRVNTADCGDPETLLARIRRARQTGERCFILLTTPFANRGEIVPLSNTSPWLWQALVQCGGDSMWSPETPTPPGDPVALFRRLFRLTPHPDIKGRGIPVPLDGVLNADLGTVDGFPRFNDPLTLERARRELAAMPENFDLALGGGVRCYAALCGGETRDRRLPDRVAIPLGNCRTKYLALLLTCSPPLQQADFDPACHGKLAFDFNNIAYVTFTYANGKSSTVNLRYMIDLVDWNRHFSSYRAPFAVTGADQYGRFFHFDKLLVKNPHPELAVRTLIFGSHRRSWLAPALLAVSLLNAENVALPPRDPNAAVSRISHKPIATLNIPRTKQIDFENGGSAQVAVEVRNARYTGERKAHAIDYPVDVAAPSRNHVMRITIPPATPEAPDKPIELVINIPGDIRGPMRSLGFSACIDHPEYLEDALQILSDNRNASYTQKFTPGKRWRRIWTAFGNPDMYSRTQLHDVYRGRMRRIVFQFRELPGPVAISIDDIGYSRWLLHTRPEIVIK